MFKKITRGISSIIGRGLRFIAPKKESSFFFISLLVLVGIVLLGFIPMAGVNGLFAKNLLLPFFAGMMLILVAGQALKQGVFTLLEQKSSLVIGGSLLVMLIVSFFAVAPKVALFGSFGETPSFLLLLSLAIIFYVAAISFKKFSHTLGLLLVLAITYSITFLHIIIRIIFGPQVLSFGFMNTVTTTLIGSWTDFAILSVIIMVLGVICFEVGKFTRPAKIITGLVTILGFLGMVLVNMKWIWIFGGASLLVFSVYTFSLAYWDPEKESYESSRTVPWFTILLFIATLVGLIFGSFVTQFIGNYRSISYQEVYPSIPATFQATVKGFTERPLTGTGLGDFDHLWNLVKPVQLSGTHPGSLEFASGYSFVTTVIATTGVLGIFAIIALFGIFCIRIVRVIKKEFSSIHSRFMITLTIAGAVMTSLVLFIDYPGTGIMLIWVIFMGSLWGIHHDGEEKKLSFVHDPRTSFFGMIVIVLLVAVGAMSMYISIRKTVSIVSYSTSLQLLAQNNIDAGVAKLVQANQLWSSDFYHRALANQVLMQVRSLGNQSNIPKETLGKEVERILSLGVSYANAATTADPNNYRNWMTLGNVYQFFGDLRVEGALEKAKNAYTKASQLSPNDRTLDILFANNYLSAGDKTAAVTAVNDSIKKYPTQDAYTWLYQQDISEKSFDKAAKNLVNAISLDTTNYGLINEFGILMFVQGNYQEAATAFEQSLSVYRLQPAVFAYLGVSYESLSKTDQAEQVFAFLRKELPDNADTFIDQARKQKGSLSTQVIPQIQTPTESIIPVSQ